MSCEFSGVEIYTGKRFIAASKIKAEILLQAKENVREGLHIPMYFAFHPGLCRVFYGIDQAGIVRFQKAVNSFQKMTTRCRPYRVAFVYEGIVDIYPDDLSKPRGSPYYNALSLVIQDPVATRYSTHLILSKDGTRELSGCIFDSELVSQVHVGPPPVSFFDSPTEPFSLPN